MKHGKQFAAALAMLLLLTACGNTAENTAAYDTAAAMPEEAGFYEADYEEYATAETSESVSVNVSSAKWIYTANLDIYATDYAAAQSSIEALVSSCGGYFESRESYEYDSWRDSYYTVRIPSEQFEPFLGAVSSSDNLRVVYQNTTKEDVSETYYDIENRLTTLQTKLARLQELLSQAESMEDIITIESEISDVEYQIENYTGTKNHYDSLIDYATIYISLEEVSDVEAALEPAFGQRIAAGFTEGVARFADGFQDAVVWLASHILTVLLIAVIAAAAIALLRRRKKRKAAGGQTRQPLEDNSSSE